MRHNPLSTFSGCRESRRTQCPTINVCIHRERHRRRRHGHRRVRQGQPLMFAYTVKLVSNVDVLESRPRRSQCIHSIVCRCPKIFRLLRRWRWSASGAVERGAKGTAGDKGSSSRWRGAIERLVQSCVGQA
jgi:hypothetical protein